VAEITRGQDLGVSQHLLDLSATPRTAVSRWTPQGRKAARAGELYRVCGGSLHVSDRA